MDKFHQHPDRLADVESEFDRHIECGECGSSDGNSLYTDGHTFCFVCHTWKPGENSISTKSLSNITMKGEAVRLPKRGLYAETCQKYKIYRDGNILRFYYFSPDGILKGAKAKTPKKVFTYEGESDGSFFGQNLFPSTGKRVVITEGELDAASCYQTMSGWPMVSLPTGAAGAKKAMQRNLQWLQGYEEIVLFFDNDEAGRQATEAAASVLPPGRVKIAHIQGDYKDASDALAANDSEAISRAIWDARDYRPDGIIDAKSLLELVTTPNPPCIHEYKFKGLQDKLHGIRYGELISVCAGTGAGKSSFCRDLAVDLLQAGHPVGYVALEESNRRTALGLMSAAVGKSLHLGQPTHDELTKAFDSSINNWKLYLFDGFGSFDPDIIYNRIEYLATGLECKFIFLDHLSILISGLDGDERRTIDITMTRLRSLVERTGITLFLVSHLKRPNGEHSHEEGGRVTLGQLRGSASISQLSDTCLALERDQQADNADNSTTLRVLKQRYSGETGVACTLKYNLENCSFTEHEATKEFDATTDF
jgi:twinkle protein